MAREGLQSSVTYRSHGPKRSCEAAEPTQLTAPASDRPSEGEAQLGHKAAPGFAPCGCPYVDPGVPACHLWPAEDEARRKRKRARARRVLSLAAMLLGLYACGGSSPTNPTPAIEPDLSPAAYFLVHGDGVTVDAGMRAAADRLWLETRGCIAADGHGDPPDPRALRVDVVPGFLTDCGGGPTGHDQIAGCSYHASTVASYRIRVDAAFYRPALRHELTNFAYFELGREGDASPEYGGHDLLFERCAGDGLPWD